MTGKIFSDNEARLLRKFANLDQGHRFIRMVIRFRMADAEGRLKILDDGLSGLYRMFADRGTFEDAKRVTELLRDKIEGGADPDRIQGEVKSIIRGGRPVCRT